MPHGRSPNPGVSVAVVTTDVTSAYDGLRGAIGAQGQPLRGALDIVSIERFARASGEIDEIYYSDVAARAAGYSARPAPPLMLSSVQEWGGGPAVDTLRPDGSGVGKESWLPFGGLQIMGGGQSLDVHAPLLAGTTFTAVPTLEDVTLKSGGSGELVMITITTRYMADDGQPLLTCTETLIGR